ncbi:phytanoyl-CoA dioxygenase family protein [Roseibium sp.]|uniref:phytanoyl-CoA dioxygenase family protein n=1 Tax=Roseibium sp. TaxID=1936156 RepID=UPI003BAFDEBD
MSDKSTSFHQTIDLNASELKEVERATEAFEKHHVIVLRNAFRDSSRLINTREKIKDILSSYAQKEASKRTEAEKNSIKKQQLSLHDLSAHNGHEVDLALDGWVNGNFRPEAVQIISDLLSGGPRINISRTTIRKKEGKESFLLPFHQDARSPSTITPRVLTCWIPMCDVGDNRPGLEIIPVPLDVVLEDDNDESGYRGPKGRIRGPGDDWVMKTYGESAWAPKLQLGDCMIFSGDVLHRSQIMENAEERTSIDVRIFSSTNVPEKYTNDISVELI